MGSGPNILQLWVERSGSVSPICRHVLTIIGVKILQKVMKLH